MDQPIRRRLTPYSESWYIRFRRKSRISRFSSGWIRWLEIPWSAIRVFIVNTTRTTSTLQKTARTCGTTKISWSKKENWVSFASFQWSSRPRKPRDLKKHFLKTTQRNNKCNLCYFKEDGLMPFHCDICSSPLMTLARSRKDPNCILIRSWAFPRKTE